VEKQACAQTEAGSGHDHGLCAFRPGVSFPSSLHKLQVNLFLIYRVQFWIAKKKRTTTTTRHCRYGKIASV
jgi:hypothetical protein